jgi:protein O-mannosyl-transferase
MKAKQMSKKIETKPIVNVETKSASQIQIDLPSFFSNTRLVSILIFVFALILYLNTLPHGFVLDDFMVIKKNSFTQKGIAGFWEILSKDSFYGYFEGMGEEAKSLLVTGGRYRPFSLLCFAFIYQFFGENTFVFHLFTILIYALTCVLLYRTLLLVLKQKYEGYYLYLFCFIAALLFTAHPIHTEVVANIKGCDEILSLMGCIASTYCFFQAWDTGKKNWFYFGVIAFFLACMSKENAVTFIVIIPLALWFFRTKSTDHSIGYSKIFLGLFGGFLLFFIIRGFALNWTFANQAPFEIMNNPFIKLQGNKWVNFSSSEKLATVMTTLGNYIKLLFFPHPLTHDYYPRQIGIMNFKNLSSILSLLFYIGLLVYAVLGIAKKDVIRFGLLFFLVTLSIVSNLLVSVGTLMNERFVFMPSVGVCLIFAALIMLLSKYGAKAITSLALLGVILVFYSFKTIDRNRTWVSNEKLFIEDVKVSKNSGKAHDDAGGVLFNRANKETDVNIKNQLLKEAIGHFDFAISMNPKYTHAVMHRAASYHLMKDYTKSVELYRQALSYWPKDVKVKKALAISLREKGQNLGSAQNDIESARVFLNESLSYNNEDPKAHWLMAVSYAKQSQFPQAVEWFQKAIALDPKNATYYYDLGTSYFRMNDKVKGTENYDKAVALDPNIIKNRTKK